MSESSESIQSSQSSQSSVLVIVMIKIVADAVQTSTRKIHTSDRSTSDEHHNIEHILYIFEEYCRTLL